MKEVNYLKAVFWDYPEFTDENNLRNHIEESKREHKNSLYLWFIQRFLEHGRVIDTLRFFSIDEIKENLNDLKLTQYTLKKWQRMIDV